MNQISYMTDERTVNYNAMAYDDISDKEDLAVEILKPIASSSKIFLRSNTYHQNLVQLPGYDEVDYWQAPGKKNFNFDDCSTIKISSEDLGIDTPWDPTGTTEISGIVAFIHDVESVATLLEDRRDFSS